MTGALNGQAALEGLVDPLANQGDRIEWYRFNSVRQINYYLNLAGGFDTIAYRKADNTIVYSYQNKVIDPMYDQNKPEKLVEIRRGGSHGRRVYYAIFREPRKPERRVQVVKDYLYNRDKDLVIAHYKEDVLIGRYLEFTHSDIIAEEGWFKQIDTSYTEVLPAVDPKTYEVTDTIVERTKFPLKTGVWIYRNEAGDTLRVEHYPEH